MADNKQKTKKQHFVPRLYLKRFADDRHKLFVFDKTLFKSFSADIADIAQEKFFYDIPESEESQKLGMNVQVVETALARIERYLAPTFEAILRRIESKHAKNIFRPEHRTYMSVFLALQATRTKEFRTLMTELAEKTLNATLKPMIEENFPNVSSDTFEIKLKKEFKPLYHDGFIFNFEHQRRFAAILHNHIWIVGANSTRQPFYVSDHPVVKWRHLPSPNTSLHTNMGIASPGIEIAFPLSPKYILLLFDRFIFDEFKSKDGTLWKMTEENVTYYNSLQVRQSYRQVYCLTNTFDLAKEMCQADPALNNPERPRLDLLAFPPPLKPNK